MGTPSKRKATYADLEALPEHLVGEILDGDLVVSPLDADVVVPEIAGWRKERMDRVPDVVGLELPPDWVCEVISPSTRRHDRGPKMRIYRRAGVPWLWIVDRASRAIEVYRLIDRAWSDPEVFEGVDRAPLPPFEAVEIHLAQIWGT